MTDKADTTYPVPVYQLLKLLRGDHSKDSRFILSTILIRSLPKPLQLAAVITNHDGLTYESWIAEGSPNESPEGPVRRVGIKGKGEAALADYELRNSEVPLADESARQDAQPRGNKKRKPKNKEGRPRLTNDVVRSRFELFDEYTERKRDNGSTYADVAADNDNMKASKLENDCKWCRRNLNRRPKGT